MKLMMFLGGLLGFLIGLGFGLVQQSAWPGVIWRASAAALGAGILMRWWGKLWISSLEQARRHWPGRPKRSTPPGCPSQAFQLVFLATDARPSPFRSRPAIR